MKQEWKYPRIDVQKFIPNEYAASSCGLMNGILIRMLRGTLTDGASSWPDSQASWKGKDKGFMDDHFDNLAGDEDIIPSETGNGWYTDTNSEESLKEGGILVHTSFLDKLAGLVGKPANGTDYWGNTKTEDRAQTVYFWGNDWPVAISEDTQKTYHVGPNASW